VESPTYTVPFATAGVATTLPAVGKNQRGMVAATLDALIEEQASAERAGLPWYMGHDPELVAQPGPEEGGPDPPVHPATETARSAKATAVTAMPRRHRKRTVGLPLNIIALTAMWSKGGQRHSSRTTNRKHPGQSNVVIVPDW
jgi:hypothetical protein